MVDVLQVRYIKNTSLPVLHPIEIKVLFQFR